jgi:hypothetical protein
MNPHGQSTLLIVVLGVVAALIVLVLKRRGVRADLNEQSPMRARTATTRIQTVVKLTRHPSAGTAFPTLRVMCKGSSMSKLDRVEVKAVRDDGQEARAEAEVAAGMSINPEPGDEIDLSGAFRQIAAQLCDSFAPKTRVKYSVVLQESIQGRTIPIETPQMTADLWQDGLQDILSS